MLVFFILPIASSFAYNFYHSFYHKRSTDDYGYGYEASSRLVSATAPLLYPTPTTTISETSSVSPTPMSYGGPSLSRENCYFNAETVHIL